MKTKSLSKTPLGAVGARIDLPFLFLVILLSAFGTVMVFSAGYAYADFRYGDSAYFIKKQTVWLIVGIGVMIISSLPNPMIYKLFTPILYALTILLLILVLIVGFAGNGAQRWISIGPLTVQPSEIAKLTMLMMLSYYFSKNERLATDKNSNKKVDSHSFLLLF